MMEGETVPQRSTSPHKDQSLDSDLPIKTALGDLRSPLMKLQEHRRTKPLGVRTNKGKEEQLQFCLAPSHSPDASALCKGGTSS